MLPRGGTLDGTRVLDLTGEPGFSAGKPLGALGADVVKIEPPGGDPVRRRGPFWGGGADPDRSLPWLATNTSKRAMTLDLERPRGREILLELVARADVFIETEPPRRMVARGLGLGGPPASWPAPLPPSGRRARTPAGAARTSP